MKGIVSLVFLAAAVLWLGTAVLAVLNFGGFEGHDFYFVSTFFGCFVLVGLQLVALVYIKKHFDRVWRELSALRAELSGHDSQDG